LKKGLYIFEVNSSKQITTIKHIQIHFTRSSYQLYINSARFLLNKISAIYSMAQVIAY